MQARITVRIPQELEQQLKERAEMLGLSSAEFTRSLIEQALEGQGSLPPTHEDLRENLKAIREQIEAVLDNYRNEGQSFSQRAEIIEECFRESLRAAGADFRKLESTVANEHGARLRSIAESSGQAAATSRRMTEEVKLNNWAVFSIFAIAVVVIAWTAIGPDAQETLAKCVQEVNRLEAENLARSLPGSLLESPKVSKGLELSEIKKPRRKSRGK